MLGKEVSHQSLRTGSDSVTQGKFIPTPRCQDRVLSLDEYPSGTLRDDGSGRVVELSVVHCEVCSVEGGRASVFIVMHLKDIRSSALLEFQDRMMSGRLRRHISQTC